MEKEGWVIKYNLINVRSRLADVTARFFYMGIVNKHPTLINLPADAFRTD